jgi:hypothetical protein
VLIEKRLNRCYMRLEDALVRQRTIVVKHLADDRAEQVRFGRLLSNKKVTPERIFQQATALTARAVAGKHILLIEDSSEISFGLQPRASGLGSVATGTTSGFYMHPALAVDATARACYGLGAAIVYKRPELPAALEGADLKARKKYWNTLSLAEKASSRWLNVPLQAQKTCVGAARMTVVADREGDIYEAFDGFQQAKLDFVVRMSKDRPLDGPGQLRQKHLQQAWRERKRQQAAAEPESEVDDQVLETSLPQAAAQSGEPLMATVREQLGATPVAGTYELKLPATDKRSAHTAVVDVKYRSARILRPATKACSNCSPALDVYVVEVRERASSVVGKEQPIVWILVTSHRVESLDQAMQVVQWYRWRWDIEQTFRLLKSQGMDIESSGLQSYERLANLAAMALVAAVRVLQLMLARDNTTNQPLTTGFSDEEVAFMQVLSKKLEGNTAKQRNPHPVGSLAYGAWIIARLGSWMGYGKTPPGPITMHRGLIKFYEQFQGYLLAKGAT